MMSRTTIRTVLPAFVALLLSVRPVGAQARPAPTRPPREHKRAERDQIEALEKQFQAAQQTGDIATMDKLLSEDYLGINPNGVVLTKAQQLDHMHTRKVVINSLQTTDQKIKLVGPIAIVTSMTEIDGMNDGVPLHGKYRYTRIYQRLPDGSWKVTSFEATRLAKQDDPATASSPKS